MAAKSSRASEASGGRCSASAKNLSSLPSRAEGDENYAGVVLVLTSRYRIVDCRGGIQWIIQRRVSADGATTAQWRGLSYHRSRDCLAAALVSSGCVARMVPWGGATMTLGAPPFVDHLIEEVRLTTADNGPAFHHELVALPEASTELLHAQQRK